MKKQTNKRSPWAWVPTLYFAQGLPYVAVMTISVIMYKRLGISNTDIALYTSWLYLPWVIKPFWSPFVDLIKTKRWWVVTMQLLVGAGFAGIAFTIPVSNFFQWTLAVFWLVAFSSATHDIAADGFYMLALNTHEQAMYVGIRSTFYRVATIVGQGLLIIVAGALESSTGLKPLQLQVDASPDYSSAIVLPLEDSFKAENPLLSDNTVVMDEYFFTSYPEKVELGTTPVPKDSVAMLKAFAVKHNTMHGFTMKEDGPTDVKEGGVSWWSRSIATPLGNFIRDKFGEKREVTEDVGIYTGSAQLVAVKLSKAPEEGEKMVLNTRLNKGDRSLSLLYGERLEFTESNWDKPAYMIIQADSKLDHSVSAQFEGLSGNVSFAWSVTFFILAGFFIAIMLYHRFILPRPDSDKPAKEVTAGTIFKEFFETFASFFKKKQVWVAIAFMLLYRFPEAQLVKLITPFLLDPKEIGGLGLTTGQVGLVYGTLGILGLTLGGIIGGVVAAKGGLKKWLWPMAWSISLTCITFVYLSVVQPESL
ncbi:MAG: MFS transporter, partial [Bacteroidales bacterium]|nr:MFS transporter [Bacteroidales bacterium]